MVSKKWSDIKDKTVKEIIDFLIEINKTRLPILENDTSIKYIIHSSLLTKPFKDDKNQVKAADTSEKMSAFIEKHLGVVDSIVLVKENEILENVRKTMNSKPECKDVFIENNKNELVGWLTDTLILRYINSKKL